jgi:molecular chaperone GrpE
MTDKAKSKINLDDMMNDSKMKNQTNDVQNKKAENNENMEQNEDLNTIKSKEKTQKNQVHLEEIQKLKDELLRSLAENQNLRKRYEKEKEDIKKFALSSALSSLCVPFENLFTALKIDLPEDLKENEFVKSVLEGLLMVQKSFEGEFEKLGLVRIFPEGQKFDPNLHQAVAQVEMEGKQSGIVINVVSAGFQLNGRVLKPAMVVVAK